MYADRPYKDLPWFSARPYPWVVRAAGSGMWRAGARILDVGCGAGTNSLFLARAGFRVSGIDLAEGAIAAARARAEREGLRVDFRVEDVLELPYPDEHFGGAIDIGCFHTLPVAARRRYSRELARVIHPRRSFALAWVGRESRGEEGPPHRPSVEEVAAALEDEFLFVESRFVPGGSGRRALSTLRSYWAELGRRSFPRPPKR
jgi:SAM-dependent methyltransferase